MVFKNSDKVIVGLVNMFGYTSLLIPTMNAILAMVNKYDLNLDTLYGNFLSLATGITTLLAKQGINWIFKQLKDKLKIKKDLRTDKFSKPDITHGSYDSINES
jgi:hypothetical protein